jgi:hypothetical protein
MVEDRTTDGKRIAQLLSSEVSSREDSGLDALDVVNADPDVEPSADGELAYEISFVDSEDVLAEVYVHDDRARIEFREQVDAAAEAAEAVELRVRPKAVEPPRTIVFVEDGAEVKRATDVFVAIL